MFSGKIQSMENINAKIKIILAIDTSCDDTSVAVTRGNMVLSNVISSQIELHSKWGGVVPGIARREHEKRIDLVVMEALELAFKLPGANLDKYMGKIDAIAVTQGPGLAIALEVGVRKAKELALKFMKPLIPVDHMEGHLLSGLAGLEFSEDEIFPALGVLVSGGHTQLILANGVGDYKIIGETLDDAIGESFDKVAKMLGFEYPGGPIVAKFAEKGDPSKYDLPISMKNSNEFNVSYSGLKTAVLYLVRDLMGQERRGRLEKGESWKKGKDVPSEKISTELTPLEKLGEATVADICASFQYAAVETLMNKIRKILGTYKVKSVLLGGGVVNNKMLREEILKIGQSRGVRVRIPQTKELFMDNAGMMGVAGYLSAKSNPEKVFTDKENIEAIDRDPGKVLMENL